MTIKELKFPLFFAMEIMNILPWQNKSQVIK
jgi:hypothetical protein